MAGPIKSETGSLVSIDARPPIEELKRTVEERRRELANFRTPYTRASTFLDQWVQRNFQTEGGKVGGWEPFSPVTLEQIARQDPGRQPAKLLQKTGRLRITFLPFVEDDNAGIGTELPYSKGHHEGEGRLPKRQLLPTKDLVMADIRRIFKNYTTEVLTK